MLKVNIKELKYDKLIEAIIKSHVNIMIYSGKKENNKDIKIEIPNKESFIHQCYIEIASVIYKNPYFILDIDKSNINTDKKIRKCKKIIKEAIDECIRNIIPIENILNTYLSKNTQNNSSSNIYNNSSNKSIIIEKYSISKNNSNSESNSDSNNNYS